MDMRQNAFIKIKLKNNSRLKLSERQTDKQRITKDLQLVLLF